MTFKILLGEISENVQCRKSILGGEQCVGVVG